MERKATSPFLVIIAGRLVNCQPVGARAFGPISIGFRQERTAIDAGGGHRAPASADLEKIVAVDLLVPYCGDYTEAHAWDETEQKRYAGFMEKRRRMESVERDNIAALLQKAVAESFGQNGVGGRCMRHAIIFSPCWRWPVRVNSRPRPSFPHVLQSDKAVPIWGWRISGNHD